MTTLINDLQKQEPGSSFIELFEVEIATNIYAYFHPGVDSSFNALEFRDRIDPSIIRTYVALPVEFLGFEASSDGTSNRPRITFANVLSTFGDLIGISNEELIGKKIYRRRTLEKYLYGEPNDSNPPIEYGIQSYVIDRKERENSAGVTFELASPFDLDTVKLPRRQIIPNACNWIYQGAGTNLIESTKRGACSFRTDSQIYNSAGVGTFAVYDKDDNPLATEVTLDLQDIPFSSPITKNEITSTSASITRRNLDGTTTNSVSKKLYWQALITGTATLPSFSNVNYRTIRGYVPWVSGTTYFSYVELGTFYNDIVLYENTLWQCKITTDTTAVPTYGPTWTRIDICGKKLNSCAIRFGWQQDVLTIPKVEIDNSKELPYGGFPASRTLEG